MARGKRHSQSSISLVAPRSFDKTTSSIARFLSVFLLVMLALGAFGANPSLAQDLPVSPSPAGAQTSESVQSESSDSSSSAGADSVEPPGKRLTDAIGADELASSWTHLLQHWVEGTGLNQGVVEKAIFTGIAILIGIAVLLLFRFLLNRLENKAKGSLLRAGLPSAKAHFYFNLVRGLVTVVVLFSTLVGVAFAWNFPVDQWLSNGVVTQTISTVATIFVILFIGSVLLELVVALVERAFRRWGGGRSARVDTLLPIAKNVVYIVFLVIFILMALSEIGINVMPLLAGAGVIGFAVGFGAQTLIKDLLTGFIIILEDLIQVGDVARLAGRAGLVEKITIRKVQLRDLGGIVYTIPFSEIDVVENLTKDYSFYIFDIGIAYREDVDEVMAVLGEIDKDIREDDEFKALILEPLEIFGVDQFADSAVVIKARVKTLPIKQWTVGREYNRRMKMAFDKYGIEIPFPHQTLYFGEDKDGKAPPLRVKATNLASNSPLEALERDASGDRKVDSVSATPNVDNKTDDAGSDD
ncbi:MAG TPA: mechanosensitive ion channel family protein [Marinagarivorans sp.]